MRILTLAVLTGLALPAAAQDRPAPVEEDEEVLILDEDDGERRTVRIELEREGDDGHLVIRRRGGADDGERTFRLRMPDVEQLAPLRAGAALLAEGGVGRLLRDLGAEPGVSVETQRRMRDLETESRTLARQARDGDADAERRLDAVLGELFDVRAEARRERAASLREQADAIEAALREREDRRQALVDARRAELLGEPSADW